MKATVNRKQQILEFATEAFSRDGYDRVTVKQLADQCGITEPAVYRHYPSKDAIYIAVLESLRDRIECDELFHRLENENDLELMLNSIAGHIITFYTANADMYRLLLYAALRGHEQAQKIFELIRGNYVRFLTMQFERLERGGIIVAKQHELTARCFVAMVFDCALAYTLWKGFMGKSYDPQAVVANNVPIYVRGLKA